MSNFSRSRREGRGNNRPPSALQESSLILRRCTGPEKRLSHSPLFDRGRSKTDHGQRTLSSTECFQELERMIFDPKRACITPDCFLQSRTHASASDGSIAQSNRAGLLRYPRFHPLYSYRERDGQSLPLEPYQVNPYFLYSGDYFASKRHGQGTVVLGDGSSIGGSLSNNEFVGYGVRTWATGATYQGEMMRGEAHGSGVYIGEAQGLRYEGEFANGLFHGSGRLSNHYGNEIFVGRFCKQRKAEGTWTVARQFTYSGPFVDDLPQGMGHKQYDATLAKYDGNFVAGLEHGIGTMSTSNGVKYFGSFMHGRRQLIPHVLSLVKMEIQNLSIAEYLRSGSSPNPPHFHSPSRSDKEQALLQDAFINLQTGMLVRVTVALCTGEERHMSSNASQAGVALKPVKRQMTAPPKSRTPKETQLRTRHVLEDSIVKSVEQDAVVDETGRMATVTMNYYSGGINLSEFDCLERITWGDPVRDAFFPAQVPADAVCVMIGEHLSTKGAEPPKPFFASRSSASSTGGRTPQANIALRRPMGDSTAPSTSRGDPSPFVVPLDVVSPYHYQHSVCLSHGRAEFMIRISPRVRAGEYVIVIRVPDETVVIDPNHAAEPQTRVRECVLPIRLASLDFQTQKMYVARFQGTTIGEKDTDVASIAPTAEDDSHVGGHSDDELAEESSVFL